MARDRLTPSAAVETAMEATTTVEVTSTMCRKPARYDRTMSIHGYARESATVVRAGTPIWMSPAVIPRACSNKDSVHKPIRAVEAVRRTSVRIVAVVSVGADWRRAYIPRANAYSDSNTYRRVRIGQRHQYQHTNNRQISHGLHSEPPSIRSASPPLKSPDPEVLQLSVASEAPTHLNAGGAEKFRKR
jgi:hypothetical protein